MGTDIREIILEQEKRLQKAQLESDLTELNDLIADELQFISGCVVAANE